VTHYHLHRRLLLIILTCLALFNLPLPAYAQEPELRFERLLVEQGLSHGTVFSMVQDQTGFLWFGTQSGLNKFDGYTVTVFKHDPHNPNSLSNDNAGNLFIDRAGIIWIGTWGGGLNRLNPRTHTFTRYQHNPAQPNSLSADRVQTIFEDSADNLWVGTSGGGLNLFNRQTQNFTHYTHNPTQSNSLSNNRVWRITQDAGGVLWIATSNGLNRFDPRTETFTHYKHNPAQPNSLIDNLVRTLFIDKSGLLWLGTETGLDAFDPRTETFTHYRHNPTDSGSLSDDIINAIFEDSTGALWIGSSRGGLSRFNRASHTFTTFQNDPRLAGSLSHNDVRWILEDQSGVMWFATRGGGVNKLTPVSQHFTHMGYDPRLPTRSLNNNDVRAIYQDPTGLLWIGTKGGGLNRFDPRTGQFTYFQHDPDNPNSLSGNDVYVIHPGLNGVLWLGLSGDGLNKFVPHTGNVTRYLHNPNQPNSLSHNDINSIMTGRDGRLWIGTKGGGLNLFDPHSEQFVRFQHDPANFASLGNDDVYVTYQDPTGAVWVSTYGGGLNRLDPAAQTFTRYQYNPDDATTLSNNDVYDILADAGGTLWLGTANGGLNKFDPATQTFTRYTEKDGLPSPVVYAILADDQGNLWLSTGKGLVKFNPNTGQFISFDASDGLESIGYNEGTAFKSERGEMFFGGINGLLRFYPGQIKDNMHLPPVVITRFSQPNREQRLMSLSGGPENIELTYRDDMFTFEFAALDFTNPAKNRYAYQMAGFDQEWVDAGNRRFATYTNLDPGAYTFKVKAANNAGLWNEEEAAAAVVITPPVWETWWFRLGAVAAALGATLAVYKLRVRSIKAQRERLRELVAARTAELTQANQSLSVLTNRLQHELKLAHQIEQSLLPPPQPNWPNLKVHCYTASAREVGGDFYVYHTFNAPAENGGLKYALAVGDASGKGMPAALLMAVSLASFQSIIEQALPPGQLLTGLDKALLPYTRTGPQSCAFCYLEIAPNNHAGSSWFVKAANAGCMPPLVRHKNGSVEWLDVSGLPLGLGLGAPNGYTENCQILEPGDMLILTSDGVVEAMTIAGELFGFERLEQAAAAGPGHDPAAMIAHLNTAVKTFTNGAEPNDDLTIVVLQA
jgi:ligand-binding sensor domain-containing protein/serine phosphatase RsbU (regulator of sigma subunit)